MSELLAKAIRTAAKGSGWTVKRDVLLKRMDDHLLAVHPRRGSIGRIEFRAKPAAWDHMLWSILQIEGNDQQPASFHFTGAFTCDSPALLQQDMEPSASHEQFAREMGQLAERGQQMVSLWRGYDLASAIADEQPREPYRYHMTRVVERLCCGDRKTASEICDAARQGELDLRGGFYSTDKLTPPDVNGRRPSLSFFDLAQLWMRRH